MMSYDKYEKGRQHLNGGHQRITYKIIIIIIIIIIIVIIIIIIIIIILTHGLPKVINGGG